MKILVACKRVVDYNVKIRVKTDGSGVDLQNVKMAMNPFDEIAVEEAVKLKEKGLATEVIVISVGPTQAQETLRTAMAIGADRGILVQTETPIDLGGIEPLHIAKILAEIVKRESPDLVILGKQSIDDDSNQTAQMLAALLDWPQATYASAVTFSGRDATVVREVDGGLETLSFTLPGIISTDLRLNTPRYASLPNIMKAKSKPLAVLPIADLGVDLTPQTQLVKVQEPAKRQGGRKVESVDALIAALKTEAKVI
ncbi:MAG: electron transfer flavoprotein subunit beta/FixA family protein [Pseudomonadota bacterium]